MKIAFNPLGSGALTKAPDNKDITFDLVGRVIYARGVSFDGKNTQYKTFKKHTSSDNTGGSEGLVPIPSYSTTNTRLLREDGQWVNIAEAAPPDTELSTESTNAVQNKVITNKINEILASMQLKAADVYKNIKVGTTTLVASGVNDTLEFKLGNGITITPNATNKTLEFSINATGNQGISTSYSNKQLIVKIQDEYYNKWNAVYDWYISVTEEDTDDLINKWQEIVDFLNSIAEGTDILDEFVTRKTAQTITGVKTFNTQQKFTVADGISPFTVTSKTLVTNLNADLLDGTHKSGLLTALANVNTTDNPQSIYVTVGGTTKYLKVSYSQHSTDLVNTSVTNPDSAVSGQYLKWYSQINRSGSNPYYAGTNTGFPVGNNANGILWLGTHSGPYGGQLGVSSNGRLYYRFITNNTFPTTANGGSWNRIAWTSDIPTVTNYYWANIKVSSSSSTTTTPTFATATATTSVTTPLVTTGGVLTLNGKTGVYLKYNNDGTKSIVLNDVEFKPFDAANGKLDLGASDARWKGLYAGTGSFSGNVTLYSSSGDSPHLYFQRGTTTDGIYDWDMFVTGGSLTLRQNNAGTWNTALTAADNYMSTGWRFNVGKELSVKDRRFNYGLAYYTSTTPTITGTIVITLPNGWSNSMNTYEIDIYEYNGYNEAADNIQHSKLIIDGYNYSGDSYWYNYGYTQIGSYNKGVRLGYNGSKCVIMLGTTSTTWTYPQVHLSRVITGYSNPTTWSTGYSISVITSESGYSSIVTVNRLRQRFADVVANTFRGTLSGRATSVGDGSIIMYPERSNEVNFGGTNNSGAIYFGYRATDSRPIPSNFIFGGSGSATLTATKLHGIGVLTLNGVSGIYLKYNNTDASSIVLSSTYFKPFDVANNKLSLGTNAARWSNVYSYLGNFKDTVHIYADSTGNYTEGIRLYGTAKDSTWSNIQFGCDPAATSGTHANQWLFGRDASNRLVFRNNTTDQMYLTTTGLGIGVVPTQKLHVNGNAIATNFGVNSTAGSGQGISLYGGSGYVNQYGIAFVTTGNWGTHGYVTGDWATYFTMSNTENRGWIFRRYGSGNVFSIDCDGHAYANGLVNASRFNSRVATGTQPYACTSTTLNTNLNADMLDGYHASSFAIWRGQVQTDAEADDTTYTSTPSFLSMLHNRSSVFSTCFSAFRGYWYYVGNINCNTGVGTLEMAGTAVLNISASTTNNEHSKTLLFIEGSTGNLYSYVKQSDGYGAIWSRYAKTTDIPNPANYYWANVKVSASSSTSTSPTFATSYATTHQSSSLIYLKTGDATMKIYANVSNSSSYGNEGVTIQTAFDGQDPASSSYPSSYPARAVLQLQPRGGNVAIGQTTANSYKVHISGSLYASSWLRTGGSTGWYSESYGGGWFMQDTTYVRTYNSKAIYISNTGDHAIYTAGGFASSRTSGSVFATYYNGTWYCDTLYTHGNGNLSISPPGGSLYLAYNRGNTYFGGGTYYINRSGYFNGSCASANYTYRLAASSISDVNAPNWQEPGIRVDIYSASASNKPYSGNNANGVINFSFGKHGTSGHYGFQLAHGNGSNRLYFNQWTSGSRSGWKTVAWTSDIPSVGNGTVTIKQAGTTKGSFTMNQSGNTTIELTDNNTNTHWTTRIYAGASGTAANAAATNPYLKVTDDNTYRNQVRFVGGGATTVSSDASGNITISSTNTTYSFAAKGSATQGIYLSGTNTFAAMTYSLKATVNAGTAGKLAYYSGANAISAYTSTVGDYSTPVYISGGVPISCYAKSVGSVTWGTSCSGYIYVYQFGPITILQGYISTINVSNTSSTNYVFKLPSSARTPSTSCGFALVQKDGYSNDRNTVIRLSGQYGYCDANYNDYNPAGSSYYFTAAYM